MARITEQELARIEEVAIACGDQPGDRRALVAEVRRLRRLLLLAVDAMETIDGFRDEHAVAEIEAEVEAIKAEI